MSRCMGCGITLQNSDKKRLGYVSSDDNKLCARCFRLKHYGEYQKVDLDNSDYKKIVDDIPDDSLVLYMSDIMSLDLSYVNSFKRVIVVITKRDIMPLSIKDDKIADYVKKRCSSVLGVIIVSSNKNYNMDMLYDYICKYNNGNPVYLVGNTNSGKSTLINKLISNYSSDSGNITVSMYPSTTLDRVSINLNGIIIVDTPGLIDGNNIVNYLKSNDLKVITSKREIRPKSRQINGRGSILIGDYARINYDTKNNNSMVFYVSNVVDVKFASENNNKLLSYPKHHFNLGKNRDIVIPGLGFVKCKDDIVIDVYVFKDVNPYERDNLI